MPIDKLEKLRITDTDRSSVTLDLNFKKIVCCSECGETQFTLRRVTDEKGKKVRPAKFICVMCYKK